MAAWVRRRDEAGQIELAPYQEAEIARRDPGLAAACARSVHVIGPDGTVLRSGRAVLRVLDLLGYRTLARVAGTPPLLWGVEVGYAVVARNRRFFSRFLFREE